VKIFTSKALSSKYAKLPKKNLLLSRVVAAAVVAAAVAATKVVAATMEKKVEVVAQAAVAIDKNNQIISKMDIEHLTQYPFLLAIRLYFF
jgi:hypothetical protein